jgi:hypothetical protein
MNKKETNLKCFKIISVPHFGEAWVKKNKNVGKIQAVEICVGQCVK